MLPTIETKPAPGFVAQHGPLRYPTRADWPAIGSTGTINGRPAKLTQIYFDFYAEFQTGPYSMARADLQAFHVTGQAMPWQTNQAEN